MSDHSLVLDKPPEKELEVMTVHLHLLQSVSSERLQPNALQQSFQSKLDDSCQYGDLGRENNFKILGLMWRSGVSCYLAGGHRSKVINSLREKFLDVAGEAGV